MFNTRKIAMDIAVGATAAAVFTLGYFLFTEYISPDEFNILELIVSVAVSFFFTFTNSWTFLGIKMTFYQEKFGIYEFIIFGLAIISSIFTGISDGSTYLLMIAIPSGVVLVVSVLNQAIGQGRQN
tara:strand:+ start:1149 stop:1526 length:378 start_codon:yes stop_codon:yes gene_type:complete